MCGAAEVLYVVVTYVCSLLLSHLHYSNVDHSAVKLFEDFIKHAKHVDAMERYSGGREVKVKNPAVCCVFCVLQSVSVGAGSGR